MIGRLVDGRYRVRARIARGGMATVYVATDLRLERRVALKVMHGHLTDDVAFQNRFIQEARSAARLADPHVVNVFDQGQDAGMAYLVMEYLPGITLRELLREQKRLTVAQAVTIMDATLSGLAAAHRAGIVHRDVKPENILLAEDGRIKIGDFGLARATTANTATGAQLLGTIAYLAPELVTRGTADARSDIYALGIMLYEMLTGEQPYKGEQPMQIAFQHATDSVPRPSARNPGVPEQLDELVLWATEKVPDERPTDAQQMLDRLREIERDLRITPVVTTAATTGIPLLEEGGDSGELTKVLAPVLPSPTTSIEDADNAAVLRRRTRRRRAKGGWLVALVVLLAALAGGAGWWFGSGPGSLVAVPDVTGKDFATAQALLQESALVAEEGKDYSIDVEPGLVLRTDPEAGALLDKDTVVTVVLSQGPRPQEIEALGGQPEAVAAGLVTGKNLAVAEQSVQVFDAKVAEGVVVGAVLTQRADGKTADCTKGCAAHEGDTITFTVSVGAVPKVSDVTVEEATATLTGKGLEVAAKQQSKFDDKIEKGRVIGLAEYKTPLHPGDSVTLIVSKGPQLFEVPNVTGMTLNKAKKALEQAGFRASYAAWGDLPGFGAMANVTGQDPAGGQMRAKGATITLAIQLNG